MTNGRADNAASGRATESAYASTLLTRGQRTARATGEKRSRESDRDYL
jgi:hypothetical protein